MIIYVDGDSCPVVTEILKIGSIYNVELVIVKDYNHELPCFPENGNKISVITVHQGANSADDYIVNSLNPKDIVITNDIGLSTLAISKGAIILNFNGDLINEDNIDFLLMLRHNGAQERKKKIYKHNIKKRNKKDNEIFFDNLKKLIEEL